MKTRGPLVEFPAVFVATDRVSTDGQKFTRWFIGGELTLVIVAAVGGAATWSVGSFNAAGFLAIFGFAGALTVGLLRSKDKPERQWYEGRAAAESIKTMAWRYAVRGDPFPSQLSDEECNSRFLDRVKATLGALQHLNLHGMPSSSTQLTSQMKAIRRSTLAERMNVYRTSRIADQIDWYDKKSDIHSRAARKWTLVVATANVVGALFGIARVAGYIEVDAIGVAAAVVGSASAWAQMRQHKTLSVSYALAAHELLIIRDRLDAVISEAEWASFVSDAEDAISREHTLWLARHGHSNS